MNTTIDVLVIGGGAAGSAAALQLGRIRRSVGVIDGGEPRNAPAAHMHGYLGHDGRPPGEFLTTAHAELAAYGVDVVGGRVTGVVEDGDHLACTCENGDVYRARRVVLATGLTNVLPDIPGIAEHWGDRVIHCPWCHGWEVRDQRIAVIDTSGIGTHQALLFAQLSDDVTLIRNHDQPLTDDDAERLGLGGVRVEHRQATGVAEHSGALEVALEGGSITVDAVAVGPQFEPNASMVEALVDIGDHPSGMGRHVLANDLGQTSHPLISAAGNVLNLARTREAERREWDERYAGHDIAMFSGRPNAALLAEASHLQTGRALDVGCGEGADAIWLAKQGWDVTATDISAVAIDRARAAADEADVDPTFTAVDSVVDRPAPQAFDLVMLAFPALRRAPGLTSFPGIADAVAPDGRLLLIGHVHDEAALAEAAGHGFNPDDYLSVDDMIPLLGGEFDVEVDEQRPQPRSPDGGHNHTDRVVVARRRTS